MPSRDMSEREFRKALEKHGFDVDGFCIGPLGYVQLPGTTTSVSIRNARSRRLRDILAYLIQQKKRVEQPST